MTTKVAKPKIKKRVRFAIDTPSDSPEEQLSTTEIAYRRSLLATKDLFLYDYGLPILNIDNILQKTISIKMQSEYTPNIINLINNTQKQQINEQINDNNNNNELNNEPPKKKRKKNKNNDEISMIKENEIILPNSEYNSLNNNNNELMETKKIENVTNTITQQQNNNYNTIIKYNPITQTKELIKIANNNLYKKPQWHYPWKLYKVISGHQGWVKCIDVDPSNEFFVTGSADRTIKIWNLFTGQCKLTLTGHIHTVRGIEISKRHPLMFTCGEDKKLICWDLEHNKQIRSYHGHLSGIYTLKLHPQLNILFSGGRDSSVRVWDIRTKKQIFCLSGHKNTVNCIESQSYDPQLISGSFDQTIRCWDLKTMKCSTILTNHKKSIRGLCINPNNEYTYLSAGADNIKVWKCPDSIFLRNFNKKPESIIETIKMNQDNVVVTGHNNGILNFWDYKSGYNFQTIKCKPQPGSLYAENGINACTFDVTGTRLITVETDKSIKMWKMDKNATEKSHPIHFKPSKRTRY